MPLLPPTRRLGFVVGAWLLCRQSLVRADFDPYQLNGGLVSAVAGDRYSIIAADTRLMGASSYDILERQHTRSRLWGIEDQPGLTTADGSLAWTNEEKRVLLKETPVWIGSAGCSADCEMLKRLVRAEVAAGRYFAECHALPASMSVLLSQVLYGRRGFPFYSFCVVAGLDVDGGKVYTYDAIGSYEQVAVASAGTGRELLQPILDRKFASSEEPADDKGALQHCRRLSTKVSCSAKVAVETLIDAYRSVAEREIGVGDHVILCVTEREESGNIQCRVLTVPLKKH